MPQGTKAENTDQGFAAMADWSAVALRDEWRRLFRAPPPPRVRRDLLLLGVAWKRQEQAQGGLSAGVRRRLADLVRSLDRTGDIDHVRATRLKPGARLIREWRGEIHSVLVLDDGFIWSGQRYRSLSEIACAITGAHCSGPRFFGLKADGARKRVTEHA